MPVFDLNGKVALVTGAARGIGFETARQMHARGASVAVVDLDADEAREAAERIGERTIGIAADVTDAGAMRAAVAETVERFGGLDVAMANAGLAPPSIATMRSVPAEEWERVVEVNLLGVWHTVRAALPQVSERKGHIVVVASVAAFANGMLGSSYMVSKAAAEQIGRALRTELTPFGASASVAYFGWVDTRMVQETFDRPGASVLEELAPDFLMKRIAPPRGGSGGRQGHRRAGAADLRAEMVALPLRPARPAQPAARPPQRARPAHRGGDPRRRGAGGGRFRRGRDRVPLRAVPTYDVNGKVALITGGARGIGFETARQLHMRGASVALVDVDAAEARDAAERLGERAIGIAADVTDAGTLRAAVAETVERFGGVDIAMANAGIAPPTTTTIRMVSAEEWERVIDINLLGVWNTVRAVLPQVAERQGHIVVVSSAYAIANGMLNSAYAVAKSGVEAFGRSLRTELAPLGASAGVAYFGFVDTKLVQDAFAREDTGRLQEAMPSFLLKRITPVEAGAAVVRGIEERAPRTFAPKYWRYISALRGLINPLFDRQTERDAGFQEAIRDSEKLPADEGGSAAAR